MNTILWFIGPIYEEIHNYSFSAPNVTGPNTAVISCGNKEQMAMITNILSASHFVP